eukprot:Seg1762.9 transcript_id=Seg1762.9/GoldUCD/mRNA.D3Y31 product="putative palmitoyltransferase ZDHHC21" protein_id=Seg1762.9/GoldUCD/D3Y31
MAVVIFGKRVRGDWKGIFTCTFIICCWVFAVYSANYTIIRHFFNSHTELRNAFHGGHLLLSVLTITTMFQCIISNPGQLLSVGNVELLGWQFCEQCQMHRPPRSHHCRRCAQCVRKMDHHCPWINNCVGEDNQANFTQFLFYTAFLCCTTCVLCFAYFFDWLPHCDACAEGNIAQNMKIEVVCLTIISLAFGGFTTFMFVDRLILISSDVTTLELMADGAAIKKSIRNSNKPSFCTLLSRTFGSSSMAEWLIPYPKRHIRPSYEYDSYSWQDSV